MHSCLSMATSQYPGPQTNRNLDRPQTNRDLDRTQIQGGGGDLGNYGFGCVRKNGQCVSYGARVNFILVPIKLICLRLIGC